MFWCFLELFSGLIIIFFISDVFIFNVFFFYSKYETGSAGWLSLLFDAVLDEAIIACAIDSDVLIWQNDMFETPFFDFLTCFYLFIFFFLQGSLPLSLLLSCNRLTGANRWQPWAFL